MSTQAAIALGTSTLLAPDPGPHAHHRYEAARLARTWRRTRRRELTERWLRVLGARARQWEAQAAAR